MRVQIGYLTVDSNDDVRPDVYKVDIVHTGDGHLELSLKETQALADALQFILTPRLP
jgi:hypothetical protein